MRREESLHAAALVEVARLLGLTQLDIATALGVSDPLVNYWARGKRPIAPRLLPPLLDLLWQQATARLDVPGAGSTGALAPAIRRLLRQCVDDNLARCGLEASASVQATLRALVPFTTLEPQAIRQPGRAARLETLARTLVIEARLGQLFAALLLLVEGPLDRPRGRKYYARIPSQKESSMPYHTTKKGSTYQTVSDTGKVLGTHPTKKQAQAQATAVNIAEGHVPGVKPRKKGTTS